MTEEFGEPLPPWATGLTNGNYMQVGAQLCTKDGRRCGNAFVYEVYEFYEKLAQPVALVVTDVGNEMRLTEIEIKSMFYLGQYVLDTEEAYLKRCK